MSVLADHPVNVALDCVAGPDLGPCLQTLARGGRWVVITTLGGTTSELNMLDFFKRGVKLIGSTLRSRSAEMKREILARLQDAIWPAFAAGDITPVIHKTLPIRQAEEAHAILQRAENLGKVVLTVP